MNDQKSFYVSPCRIWLYPRLKQACVRGAGGEEEFSLPYFVSSSLQGNSEAVLTDLLITHCQAFLLMLKRQMSRQQELLSSQWSSTRKLQLSLAELWDKRFQARLRSVLPLLSCPKIRSQTDRITLGHLPHHSLGTCNVFYLLRIIILLLRSQKVTSSHGWHKL